MFKQMHLFSTSTELFAFLSLEVVRLPLAESNELYATDGSGVLCTPAVSYCARLSPCSQEEADSRLLLDAADAVQKGCNYIAVYEIVFTMNPTKWLTLPQPHALIACDSVPSFAGRGKKTTWNIR